MQLNARAKITHNCALSRQVHLQWTWCASFCLFDTCLLFVYRFHASFCLLFVCSHGRALQRPRETYYIYIYIKTEKGNREKERYRDKWWERERITSYYRNYSTHYTVFVLHDCRNMILQTSFTMQDSFVLVSITYRYNMYLDSVHFRYFIMHVHRQFPNSCSIACWACSLSLACKHANGHLHRCQQQPSLPPAAASLKFRAKNSHPLKGG